MSVKMAGQGRRAARMDDLTLSKARNTPDGLRVGKRECVILDEQNNK